MKGLGYSVRGDEIVEIHPDGDDGPRIPFAEYFAEINSIEDWLVEFEKGPDTLLADYVALQIRHFYFQFYNPDPMLLFNRQTDQLDFRLFDKAIEFARSEVATDDCEIFEQVVCLRRFSGYFLCVPDNAYNAITSEALAGVSFEERPSLSSSDRKRARGPKPGPAWYLFKDQYPEGLKDEDKPEAIAAEFLERGIKISSRQILNYSNKIKNESD